MLLIVENREGFWKRCPLFEAPKGGSDLDQGGPRRELWWKEQLVRAHGGGRGWGPVGERLTVQFCLFVCLGFFCLFFFVVLLFMFFFLFFFLHSGDV